MMKILYLFFVLLIPFLAVGQNWTVTEVASLPEPVSNNAVCEGFSSEGSFIYSFAGIDSTLLSSGIHLKSWRVNTSTLQVEELDNLPDTLGKIAAAASRIGNIIYIIGGYHILPNGNEISSNRVHRFDITQNQFITDGTEIPVPIDDQVQAVYQDSLIFVVTGWSNNGNVPNVQIYNAYLDSWSVGEPVPNNNNYKCFGASGEILGDTLYYFGGAGGFNFAAQTELRKGFINPQNPEHITWSEAEPEPIISGYRAAACTTSEAVHWLGGSTVTYNFNAVAYNGSGQVQPINRTVFYHPTSGDWGNETDLLLPMDLRGVANTSTTKKYLIGGIGPKGTVLSTVLELNYQGTLSTHENSINETANLFPNPSNGIIRSFKSGTIRLFNSYSQLVATENLVADKSMNLSWLPDGLYLAVLQEKGKLYKQQLILAK